VVDTDALKNYSKFLIDNEVHGLFLCGTTGEFSSFDRTQRKTIIQTVAEVADSTPVLAGCGDTCFSKVLKLINDAAVAGADIAVVVTPYYLKTTSESLREFYELVANESLLPIILYHIPELTHQDLPVDSVVQLAEHNNIVGIKDTSRDLLRLWETIERTPSSFYVFQGATSLAVPSVRMGADGIVPTTANVFPHTLANVYDACHSGDYAKATALMQEVVLPFLSSLASVPSLAAVKYLIGEAGPDIGPPVSPLSTLTDEEKDRLLQAYRDISERASAAQT